MMTRSNNRAIASAHASLVGMRVCVMVFRFALVQTREVLLHGHFQLTAAGVDVCVQALFGSLSPSPGLRGANGDQYLLGLVLNGDRGGALREVSRICRESVRELRIAPRAKENCLFDAAGNEQPGHFARGDS